MTRYAVDIRLGRKPPACPNTSEPWVENALACGSEVLGGGGGGLTIGAKHLSNNANNYLGLSHMVKRVPLTKCHIFNLNTLPHSPFSASCGNKSDIFQRKLECERPNRFEKHSALF